MSLALLGCAYLSAWRVVAGIPEPDLVWYGKIVATSGDTTVRLTSGTLTWLIEPIAGGTPWALSTQLTNINDQFSFILRVACESPEPLVLATTNTVVLSVPALSYRRLTATLDGQPLTLQSAPSVFTPPLADRGRLERIDLVLGELPTDSDGDGLADSWEQLYFGNLDANPDEDSDQDGVTNLNEYRAGTNPRDPASRFELIQITRLPEGTYLRWTSQPNRRYTVRRSTSLMALPSAYQVVQSGLAATPPFNEFIDTTTHDGNTCFYFLQIED